MSPDTPDKMLTRIRALLAKAEDRAATPAEAEAYTAKATELMARYGIDRALLAAADPTSDIPGDRIVVIDGSYALDKQNLLSQTAIAVGCRTVLRTRYVHGAKQRQVHLFGYGSDLERAEMLYTSLLVQAFNSLAQTPVPWDSNPAAFRRSWLQGFTYAIVARLTAAETAAKQNATRDRAQTGAAGPSVALVLADRASVVQARVTEAYPKLGKAKPRKLSTAGLREGYDAGNRADIGGPRIDSRRRSLRS